MENKDKGLTVPKWVLIVRLKIPQIPQNLSAQVQKFWISMKKGFIGRPQSVTVAIAYQIIYQSSHYSRSPKIRPKIMRPFFIIKNWIKKGKKASYFLDDIKKFRSQCLLKISSNTSPPIIERYSLVKERVKSNMSSKIQQS